MPGAGRLSGLDPHRSNLGLLSPITPNVRKRRRNAIHQRRREAPLSREVQPLTWLEGVGDIGKIPQAASPEAVRLGVLKQPSLASDGNSGG